MSILNFLLTCIVSIAVIVLTSVILEKLLCNDKKPFESTRYISYIAIFSSMSAILMLFEIPLLFIPSFYKIDLSEIPILICTFYLGPVSGAISELLKIMLKLLIKGTSSAFVGDFANYIIGCTFIIPASIIYHYKPSKKSAAIGMIIGTVIMTVIGSIVNAYYLLPKFAEMYNWPLDQIIKVGTELNKQIVDLPSFVLFAVVPFNLLKGLVDTIITFLLYKRISPLLHKYDKNK